MTTKTVGHARHYVAPILLALTSFSLGILITMQWRDLAPIFLAILLLTLFISALLLSLHKPTTKETG